MTHAERHQFEPVVDLLEQRLMREVEREQVVHVDLADYQIGSPKYERLIQSMNDAVRFTWPEHVTVNV